MYMKYITAGNLLIHSILLCSLNVEENFLVFANDLWLFTGRFKATQPNTVDPEIFARSGFLIYSRAEIFANARCPPFFKVIYFYKSKTV